MRISLLKHCFIAVLGDGTYTFETKSDLKRFMGDKYIYELLEVLDGHIARVEVA